MEIGKVKVLHKGGDSGKCGNYRPLTMLSIPCKIAESIICDTIDPRPRGSVSISGPRFYVTLLTVHLGS